MEKVNFSGGEPFIKDKGRYLGELVRYCKEELCLPSVTIVSNGSLITEEWFQEYGKNGIVHKLSSCYISAQCSCSVYFICWHGRFLLKMVLTISVEFTIVSYNYYHFPYF